MLYGAPGGARRGAPKARAGSTAGFGAGRVGTLRERTAIILLTGFLGGAGCLPHLDLRRRLGGLWLGRWHWIGAQRDHWRLRAHVTRCCALGEKRAPYAALGAARW